MMHTALALASRGLHVFPCLPRDKRPACEHGCKDATIDIITIRQWWGERPDCNIGVATGIASHLVVVDVDDAEHELRKLEEAHGALPPSVEVITARGRHIWLRTDRPTKNTAGKLAPGLDTRGDGGFVICPPSIHPSGRRYTWSVDSAHEIAPAPPWLLDMIATTANGHATALPTPPAEWRELVENGVAEGARDNSVAKLAGHLLRRHVDPVAVLGLLQAWNDARCRPPLPPADITRIVHSIAGKELRRREVGNGR